MGTCLSSSLWASCLGNLSCLPPDWHGGGLDFFNHCPCLDLWLGFSLTISVRASPHQAAYVRGLSTDGSPAEFFHWKRLSACFSGLRPKHVSVSRAPSSDQCCADFDRRDEGDRGRRRTVGSHKEAVPVQSTALNALVGGDGLSDYFDFESRRRKRERLQELAQQKGLFFSSVFQQMSRRMSPATSSNATPMELMSRGATCHVERYGGFGKRHGADHVAALHHPKSHASRKVGSVVAVCL